MQRPRVAAVAPSLCRSVTPALRDLIAPNVEASAIALSTASMGLPTVDLGGVDRPKNSFAVGAGGSA